MIGNLPVQGTDSEFQRYFKKHLSQPFAVYPLVQWSE